MKRGRLACVLVALLVFAPAAEAKVLKKGSKGPRVEKVQRWLGLPSDGIFGKRTKAAVKRFQRKRGLTADGIVGPATWSALKRSNRSGGKGSKGGKGTTPPNRPTATPGRPESTALKIAWWAILALVFIVPIAISNLTFIKIGAWQPWQLPLTYDQFDIAKVFTMRAATLIAAAAGAWHILVLGGEVRFIKKGGDKPFRFFTWFEFLVLAMLAWLAITTRRLRGSSSRPWPMPERATGRPTSCRRPIVRFR